ncbi:MAG: hypothetical protein Kow0032_22920 [Methyloligellaceae bacterium]|nr:MAG: DUF1127 domain-containing protein [Alphaproteobacteria bacterium]
MYILSAIARAWRKWRERNRARRQLRALDDHLLRDIGIRRDSIDEYVEGHTHSGRMAGQY